MWKGVAKRDEHEKNSVKEGDYLSEKDSTSRSLNGPVDV